MAETLPSDVSVFTVVGRLVRGITDTADSGQGPDLVPVEGASITFTPSVSPPIFRFPNSIIPTTLFQETVTATTDDEGYLIVEGETARGVQLMYGLDPDIEPTGWTWRVNMSVGGNFPDRTFSIAGGDGTTIDLSSVIPVADDPGQDVVYWNSVLTQVNEAANAVVRVVVSTGAEARPSNATFVIWVGGSSQPVNMADGDIWYSPTAYVAGTAPTITLTTLNALTVGTAFSQTLTATGDLPITWAVISGTVPAGLTLSSTGVLSGTPTTEGAYNFTVQASNGTLPNSTQQYTGTVAASGTALTGFSVFGDTSPGGADGSWVTDGIGATSVANGFYTTGSPVTVTGLRYWMPSTATLTEDLTLSVRLFDWAGSLPTGANVFAATVLETVTVTDTHVAGWNEVALVTPITLPAISAGTGTPDMLVISAQFGTNGYYAQNFGIAGGTEVASADDSTTKLALSSEGRGFYSNQYGQGTVETYYGLDFLFEV